MYIIIVVPVLQLVLVKGASYLQQQAITGIEEVPSPPDPVVPFINICHHHCPGPVVGVGPGSFRPVSSGEYTDNSELSAPEIPSISSSCDRRSSNLRIYYQNVRGLRTKIDAFFLSVSEEEFDLIVLTETWLDDRISTQLFGPSYAVYRTDRSHLNSHKSRGGGVLIAITRRLTSYLDPAPISLLLEQLWVLVEVNHNTISIGVIYLPPNRKNDSTAIDEHVESIGSVSARLKVHSPALLFGDYNQAGLQWCFPESSTPVIDPLTSHISEACCALLDEFNLHGFSQSNTHLNRNGRLLDLVLANDAALPISSIALAADPLIDLDADHPALVTLISLHTPIVYVAPSEQTSLNFRRANYALLSDELANIDWNFIESTDSVNVAVEYFCTAVVDAIFRVAPARRPPHNPPWSNRRLRELKRKRSTALRSYSNCRSSYFKRQFNLASRCYRQYNRFLYNRYVKRTEANLRTNPRGFWSFVNTKRKDAGLPCSMFFGNSTANNDPEKCNLFARHFKRVFNNSSTSAMQVAEATSGLPCDEFNFDIPHFTEEMMKTAMRKLTLSYAAGPDGIPSAVLKLCADVLCSPLTTIFNLSVQQSEFPTRWNSGWQVDAAYMDLKAAFDSVNHEILLAKLDKLGVSSRSVNWFRSYLLDRSVRIKIGLSESETFSNNSGVPQGSNLGPLLFSLFLTDVSLLIPPECRFFFADDVKIFKLVKCHSDCQDLQTLVCTFADWCSRNMLSVSVEKCNVISYHRKNQPIIHDYILFGCHLDQVQHLKDLGVILDSGLSFRNHYHDIVARANRQLGFIFKIADEFRGL
ncbi:uncharacterized protein LOC129765855 [Toxorhynchites rutilus septentrionalis]|uniref:uncharacterized protein LOC129765855 n=1 Tax=Toxorhynchites rutilus septentrionalis TaxID=329112 RepID=UPI00247833B1|nr:uncharacterized protein LOC129765855 [Toxorhynchites rutilus septentrionalis]